MSALRWNAERLLPRVSLAPYRSTDVRRLANKHCDVALQTPDRRPGPAGSGSGVFHTRALENARTAAAT
jgi:hypothetical protein